MNWVFGHVCSFRDGVIASRFVLRAWLESGLRASTNGVFQGVITIFVGALLHWPRCPAGYNLHSSYVEKSSVISPIFKHLQPIIPLGHQIIPPLLEKLEPSVFSGRLTKCEADESGTPFAAPFAATSIGTAKVFAHLVPYSITPIRYNGAFGDFFARSPVHVVGVWAVHGLGSGQVLLRPTLFER